MISNNLNILKGIESKAKYLIITTLPIIKIIAALQ
jgi:hypothetical protein